MAGTEQTTGPLAARVAIVTGGAGGLGAAICRRLHRDGAVVTVADVDTEAGEALAAALGGRARFRRHDVTSAEGWAALACDLDQAFGRIDILVNNAAVYAPRPLESESADSVRRVMEINQLGPLLGMQAVIGAMRRAGGGSIVNISSTGGLRGYPGTIAYAATKWALRGMTKVAARELAAERIRVNSIHPGLCETPMAFENPPDLLDDLRRGIPLGRLGDPAEIAAAVAYLASDESSYVTGAELTVDGGATA